MNLVQKDGLVCCVLKCDAKHELVLRRVRLQNTYVCEKHIVIHLNGVVEIEFVLFVLPANDSSPRDINRVVF